MKSKAKPFFVVLVLVISIFFISTTVYGGYCAIKNPNGVIVAEDSTSGDCSACCPWSNSDCCDVEGDYWGSVVGGDPVTSDCQVSYTVYWDGSQDACECYMGSGHWNLGGGDDCDPEQAGTQTVCCCEDDSIASEPNNEHILNCKTGGSELPFESFSCSGNTNLCCDTTSDCPDDGTCHPTGTCRDDVGGQDANWPDDGYCEGGTWYEQDSQESRCNPCFNDGYDHYSIGGEVAATTCCEDDNNEHLKECQWTGSEDACGEKANSAYSTTCCDSATDCIYQDECYPDGQCHPNPDYGNIYCDEGQWAYDTGAPAVRIFEPDDPTIKQGQELKEVEFEIEDDYCDIMEDTVEVSVNGTTWNNYYFSSLSNTFNGPTHCTPPEGQGWGEDYWSPYPNMDAKYMFCHYDNEPLIKPGLMSVTVCAQDFAGNQNCTSVSVKCIVNTTTGDICYRWNAISLPELPIDPVTGDYDTDPADTQVLEGVPYDRITRYRSGELFDAFSPEIPPGVSQNIQELEVGKGYYLFINDTTADYQGSYANCIDSSYWGMPDNQCDDLELNSQGLYFFGVQENASILDQDISDVLSGIPHQGPYYYSKRYNAPYGRFIEHPAFTRFETGKGYWINYTGSGGDSIQICGDGTPP